MNRLLTSSELYRVVVNGKVNVNKNLLTKLDRFCFQIIHIVIT